MGGRRDKIVASDAKKRSRFQVARTPDADTIVEGAEELAADLIAIGAGGLAGTRCGIARNANRCATVARHPMAVQSRFKRWKRRALRPPLSGSIPHRRTGLGWSAERRDSNLERSNGRLAISRRSAKWRVAGIFRAVRQLVRHHAPRHRRYGEPCRFPRRPGIGRRTRSGGLPGLQWRASSAAGQWTWPWSNAAASTPLRFDRRGTLAEA